jgi:DNA-binding transcriptional regulator of glucitol operon
MKTLLISVVTLSALSGCAMSPQQAQAWSEGFGDMQNTVAQGRAQYNPQPVQPSYICRGYGSFTRCDPN